MAIGRALLSQPKLLLMDEPLSALDRATKDEILPYPRSACTTRSALPVLYVSHDITEVERLADHLVLLDAGRVVAAGPLGEVLADSSLPIARSSQASTVLTARVVAFDARDGITMLDLDGETLLVPRRIGEPGTTHRVRIAATDVSLAVQRPSLTSILNVDAGAGGGDRGRGRSADQRAVDHRPSTRRRQAPGPHHQEGAPGARA